MSGDAPDGDSDAAIAEVHLALSHAIDLAYAVPRGAVTPSELQIAQHYAHQTLIALCRRVESVHYRPEYGDTPGWAVPTVDPRETIMSESSRTTHGEIGGQTEGQGDATVGRYV